MLSNVDVSSWKFYPDALCSLAYSPLWTFNMYKLDALSYGFCGTLLDNNPVCSSVLSVTVKTNFFFFLDLLWFFFLFPVLFQNVKAVFDSAIRVVIKPAQKQKEKKKKPNRGCFLSVTLFLALLRVTCFIFECLICEDLWHYILLHVNGLISLVSLLQEFSLKYFLYIK